MVYMLITLYRWFMPINIGITFLVGGTLGWIAAKLIKPKPHLEGLLIAMCSTGNLGNILLIIVPAICTEGGSPFGEHSVCKSKGLSYSSFSMALGSLCIWTYTFQLIKSSSLRYTAFIKQAEESPQEPNKDPDSNENTRLLNNGERTQEYIDVLVPSSYSISDVQPSVHHESVRKEEKKDASLSSKLVDIFHKVLKELLAPPTLGSIVGLIFGATPWLKKLVIGDDAPLRVIQDSATLLGDGTIPCITLILGGNIERERERCYISRDGTIPCITLILGGNLIQVLTMWSYLAAAFALTGWSTVFMWILA
ncbi:Auxin efflux carrier [Cynara cardunculus var. scolymus]|uniref:Auxin efflux carrier n=1 Tax=Cynara cardunculus var. scolymus TaxID=59895 RepID=A0A103YGK8_CYNCS|nr:Auxin efflux carrier [Cynara cardunculus var. scolymus]